MKALVTGGAGYIGSILVAKLIEAGHQVNVIDNLSTGHRDSVHPKAKFMEGDILNQNDLRKSLVGCDVVFHFAAKTLVEESVRQPDFYHSINVNGTRNVLNSMVEANVSKIIFASTCAVYKAKDLPINENDVLGPTSPYGQTKLLADELLQQYCHVNGIGGFSFRFFNAAGAFYTKETGWLEENHNPETHLIPNLLASSARTSFKLYGKNWETSDGTCIRDYVHVADLADICVRSVAKIRSNQHEVFNLGNSIGVSVQKVIEQFEKISEIKLNIEVLERRAGDAKILVADSKKAKEMLNWSPRNDLYQIIKSILKIPG
jgi:UDP-glucose 4-epimerase